MPSLSQDIDDLDRMIDTDAAKDAVRSQIRLIDREVAALQSEHASLENAYSDLENAYAKLIAENAQLNANAPGMQFESIDIPPRSRIDGLL